MARLIDAHIPWQEIPDAWMETFQDVFYFMDGLGFRHAIPAYLCWSLRQSNQGEQNSCAAIYQAVTSQCYRDEWCHALSADQQKIIADFIQYVEELH